MKQSSSSLVIIGIFVGFCILMGLAFLFGWVFADHPFLAYPLEFLGFFLTGGVFFYTGVKRLRKAKGQGEIIHWYKQPALIAALAYGTILITFFINWLVPDQRNNMIKDSVVILLAAFFLGLVTYCVLLLLRQQKV